MCKEGAKGQNKQFVNLKKAGSRICNLSCRSVVHSVNLLWLLAGNSFKHSRWYNSNARLCFIIRQKKVELNRQRRAKGTEHVVVYKGCRVILTQINSWINTGFNDVNLAQVHLKRMSQQASNQIHFKCHILANTALFDSYLLLLWRQRKVKGKKTRQQSTI